MLRTFVAALVLTASFGVAASAHHSYAAFDREHPVSIEGEVTQVVYGNPHVVISVRAADATYSVEWGNLNQMDRWNVTKTTLATGDHVIVTGSVTYARTDHRLSIVTSIQRPADGWNWSRQLPNVGGPSR